jgi:hypothetical protein
VNQMENDWNIYKERELLHTIINQRVNFLLLFASVVIAGAAQANEHFVRAAVMTFGTFICSFLSFAVYQSERKLMVVVKIIHQNKDDLATKVHIEGGGWMVHKIIGFVLPTAIWASLCIGMILAWVF